MMNRCTSTVTILLSALVVFVLCAAVGGRVSLGADVPAAALTRAETMRLGERMYREGVLPSGEPMPAFIRGDVEVDSSAFSCSSCHLRAGLGSFEGGVVTPPTTGEKLYKPYRRPPSLGDVADQGGRFIYAKTVQERPAYTRETLASALRYGADPVGQVFNDIMPRYPLSDPDMDILVTYLESLSSAASPGASRLEFTFATIITDDVSPADRRSMLEPLQGFIAKKNQQAEMYNDFVRLGYSPTSDMKYAFRKAALVVWELKGPPGTWQKQLAGYYAQRPVFAVLGGISNQDWKPIHDFCESERLPCLFPITDFPVISDTAWYTYYFNKGYVQEGEAVARYLNRLEALPQRPPILQIIQDSPAGRALAAGFQNAWKERGRPVVDSLTMSAGQLNDPAELDRVMARYKPGVLLLWADPGIITRLKGLSDALAAPRMVFVSSGYLGKQTASITEEVRDRVYITFPYRLTPYVGPKTGGYDSRTPVFTRARDFGERRIASRSTTMLQQAALQGLNLIYDNFFRDHLIDVMSMQMDVIVRDYERLSFGPGQRYVSKGCYIIQLGPGGDPALLPRSEWVIQ